MAKNPNKCEWCELEKGKPDCPKWTKFYYIKELDNYLCSCCAAEFYQVPDGMMLED